MRVATLNVWGWFGDPDVRFGVLAETIGDVAPDVLCVQEACVRDGVDQARALAAACGLSFHATARLAGTAGDSEGIAVLSRVPLADVQVEPLTRSEPPRALLAVRAAAVTVICAHTAFAPEDIACRQLAELFAFAGAVAGPVLVAGDLNTGAADARTAAGRHGLSDCHPDLAATWPTCPAFFAAGWQARTGRPPSFVPSPRRLDYILARGVAVSDAGAVTPWNAQHGFGSDHQLLWADVRVP